ncbi:MAG: SDR family oxidoreductase, partial [Limisphaerales bacterium]
MIGPSYELYEGTNMGDMPPDYFFHKGGMVNLTRFYAALYGPRSVRVNCLAPGGFFNHQPEPFLRRYCAHTMLNRMADDTDLGGAVVFLLSEASRYITGVNLPVDGGYTAK